MNTTVFNSNNQFSLFNNKTSFSLFSNNNNQLLKQKINNTALRFSLPLSASSGAGGGSLPDQPSRKTYSANALGR